MINNNLDDFDIGPYSFLSHICIDNPQRNIEKLEYLLPTRQ